MAVFEAAAAAARRAGDARSYRAAPRSTAATSCPTTGTRTGRPRAGSRCGSAYLGLLLDLARSEAARATAAAAVATLERVLERDPAHEEAHARLMRLHALAGRRRQALRQYRQLQEALRRDLDAEPDAATRRLYEAIAAGAYPPPGEDRPPPGARGAAGSEGRAGGAGPTGLPRPLTSFVGREREVAAVRRLLGDPRARAWSR